MNELLTPTEMNTADALAVASGAIGSLTLMENAGRAVTAEIIERYSKCHVAILCGPGNNGGDGFAVARMLAAAKWRVSVFLAFEAVNLKGDAAAMFRKWRGATLPLAALGEAFADRKPPGLIVDAIFGVGLNREFPAVWAMAIAAAKVPVVAIDVPSGIDGATGRPIGAAVVADLTVTFFRKKPAHVLMPGRTFCGETVLADIGLPVAVLDTLKPAAFENVAPLLPVLDPNGHKFTRGHALIYSGPEFASGASRLAATAATRSGAGLVTLVGEATALRVHAAHVNSIMLRAVAHREDLRALLADARITAVCIGPGAGLSHEMRRAVLTLLEHGPACVLDADALTNFAAKPDELFAAIKARPQRECVITPHEGEFKRLFPDLGDSTASKIEVARQAAYRSGAVVLLKGPDTVIASPGSTAKVNTNAPAKLATAGSGDVLAGIITGLLAQKMAAFEAACAGAWLHGAAANRINRHTIIAEDLLAELGF